MVVVDEVLDFKSSNHLSSAPNCKCNQPCEQNKDAYLDWFISDPVGVAIREAFLNERIPHIQMVII